MFLKIESNKILDNNIGYVYLGSVEEGGIEDILKNMAKTNGLIVDMRCYPSYYMPEILNNLSPDYDEFLYSTIGSIQQPGLFTFHPVSMKVTANPDYYKNKIVVLVDELTISQIEIYAMAFRVSTNTTIIGSTTAAAVGGSAPIVFPGDITTGMTTWGSYYPDGTETQGVGIIPDIKLRPTIKGLKEGRDELIEFAIELIKNDQ